MIAPSFDEARFDAWCALERTRRHDVPGFEHAMFFEWLRLGRPAAPAAPTRSPRPTRPAPQEIPGGLL